MYISHSNLYSRIMWKVCYSLCVILDLLRGGNSFEYWSFVLVDQNMSKYVLCKVHEIQNQGVWCQAKSICKVGWIWFGLVNWGRLKTSQFKPNCSLNVLQLNVNLKTRLASNDTGTEIGFDEVATLNDTSLRTPLQIQITSLNFFWSMLIILNKKCWGAHNSFPNMVVAYLILMRILQVSWWRWWDRNSKRLTHHEIAYAVSHTP